MKQVCIELKDLEWPISLIQTGQNSFTVMYGKSRKSFLNYGQAASELGSAIMHALACAGKLDNRLKGER